MSQRMHNQAGMNEAGMRWLGGCWARSSWGFVFPDGLCDWRDRDFHSVSFWARRPISEPNPMVRRGPAEIPARHHTICRRCRPTTTGSESPAPAPAPAAASKGFLPPGRCPRPLMALGVPSCQCCRGHGKWSATSCFCKAATSEGWEFLLGQVRRAQLSILSSRCDALEILLFIFKSTDQVHLFLAKASFASQWVKFIYINKAQLLVGPVWIKAFL